MPRKVMLTSGLSGILEKDGTFHLAREHWNEESPSLKHFLAKYGLRLLAIHDDDLHWGPDGRMTIFRTLDNQDPEDFTFEEAKFFTAVQLLCGHSSGSFQAANILSHRIQAVRYHLERMFGLYRQVAIRHSLPPDVFKRRNFGSKTQAIKNTLDANFLMRAPGEKLIFEAGMIGQDKVSFEFDAFLVSVRIALDCFLPIMRTQSWAKQTSNWPSSFKKLINGADRLGIPEATYQVLYLAWDKWASELRDLRDVVIHRGMPLNGLDIGPLGASISSEAGLLTVRFRLPDNPRGIKTGEKARYAKERDALEYAHARYMDLVGLSLELIGSEIKVEQ